MLGGTRLEVLPPGVPDGSGDEEDEEEDGTFRESPELWKCEPCNGKKVGIRDGPAFDAKQTGHVLRPGESFGVTATREGAEGVLFLKLADGRGWVFNGKPEVGIMCIKAADHVEHLMQSSSTRGGGQDSGSQDRSADRSEARGLDGSRLAEPSNTFVRVASNSDLNSEDLSRLSSSGAGTPRNLRNSALLDDRSDETSDSSRSSSHVSSREGREDFPSLLDTSICNGWVIAGSSMNIGKISNDDLQEAALRGNIPLMQQLIRAGASVNAPMRPESSDEFMCLLHILARKPEMPNVIQVISEVIKARANLNVRSSLGSTPLACACTCLHTEAADILLKAKADCHPVDDAGCTAIRCALIPRGDEEFDDEDDDDGGRCIEVLNLLMEAGADLDDGGDIPPIVEAVRNLNSEAVTVLLEGGATSDGLHDAVDKAPISIIQKLIDAEANPFKRDQDGKTSMEIALARGEEQITTMLRDFMGDLQRRNHPHCMTQFQNLAGDQDPKFEGLRRTKRGGIEDEEQLGRCARCCGRRAARYQEQVVQPFCRKINKNKVFQSVMFFCLVLALFLPDIWVLGNINNDEVLDWFLVFILLGFFVELVVQMIGFPDTYIGSFFFYMDCVGVISVPLDHSLVVNALPTALDNAVVMRAARMAKLGARAGRFTKLVKLLRFLPGMQETAVAGTAKVISRTLNMALSTRVSCLIVLMVMVLPLFEMITYPENDFSMIMWLDLIHDTAVNFPSDVADTISDFEQFYRDRSYCPYEVTVTFPNGTSVTSNLSQPGPVRPRSGIPVKSKSGGTTAMYNFTGPHQVDALCNVLLIFVIMTLMLGSGLVLSNSVSAIVMVPLEDLLGSVKRIASNIFSSVSAMNVKGKKGKGAEDDQKEEDDDDGANAGLGAETVLLEKVLKKISVLSEITVKKSPMDDKSMGKNEREMMKGYTDFSNLGEADEFPDPPEDEPLWEMVQNKLAENDVSYMAMEEWDFGSFSLNNTQRQVLITSILTVRHDHIFEGAFKTDWPQTCARFVEAVSQGYKSHLETPYHNFLHATDACCTLNSMLDMCLTWHYFTVYERFALVVAALGHDIGHPAMNNPFLTQTKHELAVRYNDSSPLENMHCASVFEISRKEGCNVFEDLENLRYREVRFYLIEAILNTDYSYHFPLVNQIETIYDMNKDLFDTSDEMYRTGLIQFPSKECVDFFRGQDVKKSIRSIFLHYCDVSNPMKSFETAKLWAGLIIEEFFAQGDREKELGLPVGPLNDRDKVKLAFSQVGFIDFFIAPMGIAMVRLIPLLNTTMDVLLENLELWYDCWIQDANPPESEKARVTDRILKLQLSYPYFNPSANYARATKLNAYHQHQDQSANSMLSGQIREEEEAFRSKGTRSPASSTRLSPEPN